MAELLHAEPKPFTWPGPRLVTRVEAMALLRCGRDQLFKWEAEGKLNPVRHTHTPKGHVRYNLSEVEALMKPQATKPGPAIPRPPKR